MKEREGYTEMLTHGTEIDAAACATTFVLDAIVGKRFTRESFDAYLNAFGYIPDIRGNGNQTLHVAQPAIDAAIRYMKEFYFDRLTDLEGQLKSRKFKDAYQIPWTIFAKALVEERLQRYEALSGSPSAIHRTKACEMPILMPSVGYIPTEISASVDMLVEESVALLRQGEMTRVVVAVEECLKGEFAYPEDVPPPVRKGKVI